MSEWKKVRLGDVANFKTGKLNSNAAVENGKYPFFTCSPITLTIDKYAYDQDAILLAGNNAEGNFSIKKYSGKFNAYQRTYIIDSDETICNLVFLYYSLTQCLKEFKQMSQGTSTKFLTTVILNNFSISLPPLPEQQRIAAILGSLDDKIELNNRINRNLEEQAQTLFRRWFVDFEFPDANGKPYASSGGAFVDSELGKIPQGWKVGKLGEIIEKTISGDWGKEKQEGNYICDVYCIRGADIPEVKKGNKGKMPNRFILQKNFETKKLEANDIVVEISGGSPTQSTGRVCMISDSLLKRYDKDMICTNFCRAVKPKENYTSFIYYYWQYLYDIDTMFSYENGTTGIKNFDINGFLEREEILIPNIELIIRFNEIIENFNDTIFANGSASNTLAQLRDTLLPKLMNGEITVNE